MAPIIILMIAWWAFGVALIFGNRKIWQSYMAGILFEARPKWQILVGVLFVCVVMFPLPMLAPFKYAYFSLMAWNKKRRLKRKLIKIFSSIKKGKSPELQREFDELIEATKRI